MFQVPPSTKGGGSMNHILWTRNRDSRVESDLPNVTQLVNGTAWVGSQCHISRSLRPELPLHSSLPLCQNLLIVSTGMFSTFPRWRNFLNHRIFNERMNSLLIHSQGRKRRGALEQFRLFQVMNVTYWLISWRPEIVLCKYWPFSSGKKKTTFRLF